MQTIEYLKKEKEKKQKKKKKSTNVFHVGLLNTNMAFPQIFSNFFGVVVPGREANTNFVQVDETRFVTDIIAPQQISEIAFFLLPECPISEDCGVVLFYCVGDSWRYLGSLTQFNPSEIFPTGWPMNEDLLGVEMIQLGVSIERYDPFLLFVYLLLLLLLF